MTVTLAEAATSLIPFWIVLGYLALLLGLGVLSGCFFRGTSADYFVASRSIGPILLLMSLFGTTMTGFSLVGSTGQSFDRGVGVYGQMASWSGLVHSACFFIVGIRLWAVGKRCGYLTQVQFFRGRFDSEAIGYILFPILILLVIPYLLVGILGAGGVVQGVSAGMFPGVFAETGGAIPRWATGAVICAVVLGYVFLGGVRSAAWANTFQTTVFMITGVVAFYMIADALGGLDAATERVQEYRGEHLAREGQVGHLQFITYLFIPLSVAMFPHVFQHWLTARSAKTFRLAVVAHPVFILIVWAPCVMAGTWAAGLVATGELPTDVQANQVLGTMVEQLIGSPILLGILTAGILAAIMSSLDSQFVCLGTMFTNDVVLRAAGEDRFTDRQKVWIGRSFVIGVVVVAYLISLLEPMHVFQLGVWCFTGFSGLFPLVVAALYWRRVTRAGAFASLGVTAVAWAAFFFDGFIFETARLGQATPTGYLVLGMMPVAIVVLLSALTLVIVSLLTTPLPAATVERFFPPRDLGRAGSPSTSIQPETVGGQSR